MLSCACSSKFVEPLAWKIKTQASLTRTLRPRSIRDVLMKVNSERLTKCMDLVLIFSFTGITHLTPLPVQGLSKGSGVGPFCEIG
jgi:hypothetical protein